MSGMGIRVSAELHAEFIAQRGEGEWEEQPL